MRRCGQIHLVRSLGFSHQQARCFAQAIDDKPVGRAIPGSMPLADLQEGVLWPAAMVSPALQCISSGMHLIIDIPDI